MNYIIKIINFGAKNGLVGWNGLSNDRVMSDLKRLKNRLQLQGKSFFL